jgi:hypothetical protein
MSYSSPLGLGDRDGCDAQGGNLDLAEQEGRMVRGEHTFRNLQPCVAKEQSPEALASHRSTTAQSPCSTQEWPPGT